MNLENTINIFIGSIFFMQKIHNLALKNDCIICRVTHYLFYWFWVF